MSALYLYLYLNLHLYLHLNLYLNLYLYLYLYLLKKVVQPFKHKAYSVLAWQRIQPLNNVAGWMTTAHCYDLGGKLFNMLSWKPRYQVSKFYLTEMIR